MKRPITVLMLLIFAAALCTAENIMLYTSPLFAGIVFYAAFKRKRYAFAAAAAVCVILTWAGCDFRLNYVTPLENLCGKSVTFDAQLITYPEKSEGKITAVFAVTESSEPKYDGERILITIDEARAKAPEFRVGDIYSFCGEISLPKGATNPGGFDYARYLKAKRIYAVMYTESKNCSYSKSGNLPLGIDRLYSLRSAAEKSFYAKLDSDKADLLCGIMFGGENMTEDGVSAYRTTGTAHILAVSGLHTGIIYSCITFLLKKLRLKRKASFFITVAVLIMYVIITGMSVSCIRAAFMLICISFVSLIGKRPDSFGSMCLAALLIVIVNPLALYSLSFILSFASVSAILIFYPPQERKLDKIKLRPLRAALKFIVLCLCVQSALLPVTINLFYEIPLLSIPANALTVPFVGAVIVVGAVCALFGSLSVISSIAFWLESKLLGHIGSVTKLLSGSEGASIRLHPLPLACIVLYYIILFAVFGYFYLKNKRRKIFFIALCAICVFLSVFAVLPESSTKVTFLDVGFGDCAVITSADGYVTVIDCGDKGCGRYDLVPYLFSRGIYKIDTLILTHSDSDHAGGFKETAGLIKIDRLIFNGDDTLNSKRILAEAEAHNIFIENAFSGDIIQIGKLSLHILSPGRYASEFMSDNEGCIAATLTDEGSTFLFAADADNTVTGKIALEISGAKIDVFKAPHHGSFYKTAADIIAANEDAVTVISVGQNGYGLPDGELIKFLREGGFKYIRTDEAGAVSFKLSGGKCLIQSYIK